MTTTVIMNTAVNGPSGVMAAGTTQNLPDDFAAALVNDKRARYATGSPNQSPKTDAGATVFYPPTDDYAGILIAANAAKVAGGGTVKLKPIRYVLSGPIPLQQGVSYEGAYVSWDMTAPYVGGANDITGTVLVGDGTFNGFEYQPDDLNPWSSSSASISGTTLTLGGAITGTLTAGTTVQGHGVEMGTRIVSGSGTSYVVDTSQTVGPIPMYGNTPHVDGQTLKATMINAGEIRNIGLTEFKNGIKIGGLFQGGVNYLRMDNVIAFDNREWGIYAENCNDVHIGSIISLGNGVGHVFFGGSGGLYQNFGDGLIQKIFCQGSGKYYNIKTRGIVFEARGANTAYNDMCVGHIGINGKAFSYADATATLSTTTKLISVADVSNYAYGSGVYFSATVGNIRANVTYFVTSVSGTSGPGTITIAQMKGGANIQPTVAGTITINCKGGTHVEICGDYRYGRQSEVRITGFNLLHSDIESNGTVGLLFQNAIYSRLNSNATMGHNGLVCRNVGHSSSVYLGSSSTAFDCDTNSQRMSLTGMKPLDAKIIDLMCMGEVSSDVTHTKNLYLGGNGSKIPTISMPSAGWEAINLGNMLKMAHSIQGGTFNSNTGQVITIFQSGATVQLPTIVDQMLGVAWYISNPHAAPATLNTSSSQTIDNVAAATSVSLAANSTAIFIAQKIGSTFYWARY